MIDLQRDVRFRYVLVFKNVGPEPGASLQHSHYQLISTPATTYRVKAKLAGARDYYRRKERSVFHDLLRQEQRDGSRVVFENADFLVFCPMPPEQSAAYLRDLPV